MVPTLTLPALPDQEEQDVPNRANRSAHKVRVDYKPRGQKVTPSETSEPAPVTEGGNGRIRIALAVCGTALIGATVFKMGFSSQKTPEQIAAATTPEKQLPRISESVAAVAALQTTTEEESVIQPAPQFLFASESQTPAIAAIEEVPFLEVDLIDDGIPLTADVIVGNTVPFTAAATEQANDYSQEPSTLLLEVKKGDSLSGMLSSHGLTDVEVAALTNLSDVKQYMTNLLPGQEIKLELDGSRRLTGMTRQIDLEKTLFVNRIEDGQFKSRLDVKPLEKSLEVAELTLESSLFIDGAKAGLSESVIMELYSIFQWTVDFNREVRAGDKLLVLHEAYLKDGKQVKDGNILAAEYHSSNNIYNAYRHVANNEIGYYDSQGRSLEKQFLRNPVKARITSRFNLKRKHPILHTIRAHKGVDYGAPTGTPVSSAGAGRVIYAGPRGSYGNTVEIQHGDRYTTLYAHLHKFPANIKKGTRVKQGQVIGYVGRTGQATGPHLHYEFRIDGIHRDPQKVKLGGSSPLEKSELAVFRESIEPLRAKLAAVRTNSDTLAMR
jgi:murein DD-endopeptidase MepM/ murein hydrolase activator NlpD